jgi:flagellar basal-body rod protein FlgB
MPNILFDATTRGLAESLTLRQKRHEVLASNLANVETPGFKAKDLEFGTALADAFTSVQETPELPKPLFPSTRVMEDLDAPARADGNTVDIDFQMAKLSANAGEYSSLAHILGKRLALLRQAIEGTK